MSNSIKVKIGVRNPVIQAPMAGGVTTNALVSAVSNQGGLGMIGAGYMSPDALFAQIREMKQMTKRPFGVNIFVPGPFSADKESIEIVKSKLRPLYEAYELNIADIVLPAEAEMKSIYEEQLGVIVKEKVPVCSFTFGLPSEETVQTLKQADITVIGTVTTVEEAKIAESTGVDAIVVQGSEAGGHRGSFLSGQEEPLIGLMALLPQVADEVDVPLIAAGGIMDRRGLEAATCLGAEMVQMGTAFLVTKESGAHPAHKTAIVSSREDTALLTTSFSGKAARGIANDYIKAMEQELNILPYPLLNALTGPLRKAAKTAGNKDHQALWSGQGTRLAKQQSVAMLIDQLIKE